MSRDLGDFQTPLPLVEAVLDCLAKTGKYWTRVLEPTCGQGNFIRGLLRLDARPQEIVGIEIQHNYVKNAQNIVSQADGAMACIRQANIFELDLRHDLSWEKQGPLLVIGNPPWVTNAELGVLDSLNAPVKTNFKHLNGLDALTGSSNFDIAEYILLKLIRELVSEQPTIALLCKTSVARNVLQFAYTANLPISRASLRKFDSQKYFGVSVDACLFYLEVGTDIRQYQAEIYEDLQALEPQAVIGINGGKFVSDVASNQIFSFADGVCPLTWRQGIKHDAAFIVELTYTSDGKLYNKLNEAVDVEAAFLYPLLKSSDLGGVEREKPKRAVILTQKQLGEDTSRLKAEAPKLWKYLTQHQEVFDKRKSSIYTNRSTFAMFGIGQYTFSPYKVAISGMYKSLKFRTIGSREHKPVVFDDTCYFIGCASAIQAALITSILNDSLCLGLINSIVFLDAKRPITKKLLQRIDLQVLLAHIDRPSLIQRAKIELQHLGIEDQFIIWPDDLSTLLDEHFGKSEIITHQSPW
jgi:hypothetical protein